MPELINQALAPLHTLDWIVIFFNLVLLIFSGAIAGKLSGTKDEHAPRRKLVVMRVMSTVLLVSYLLSLFTTIGVATECDKTAEAGGCDPLRQLSLTGLTILFSYVFYILSHAWIDRVLGRAGGLPDLLQHRFDALCGTLVADLEFDIITQSR